MKIYKILLCLIFSISGFEALAQEDINNESFKFSLVRENNDTKMIYNGQSHAFTLALTSRSVREDNPSGENDNMHFLILDSKVLLQSSWVPIPQPLPEGMLLSQLTEQQQRQTLDGYINYELDYIRNEEKLVVKNVKKEWKKINSRFYMVWSFDMIQPGKKSAGSDKLITGQIYYSTICFNLVHNLNIPIEDKSQVVSSNALLAKIAETLTTYNSRLEIKN